MTGSRRWQRVLGEGTVIISSILLAFGIQAWWEHRGEAEREQRLLSSLIAEFQQNGELLRQAREEYEGLYMDALRILDAVEQTSAEIEEPAFEALVRSLLFARTFHLESGAHDGLLAAGELDLIRDETLRNRLAAWPSYVAEWIEEEQAVFDFVNEALVPYLADHTPLRTVRGAFAPFPDGEAPPPIPEGLREGAPLKPLADSLEFENLVYRRAQGLWHAMRDGETLRVQLSTIVELIRQNLDS